MKNFALTGVAGYIAPRHLQAIKETGNRLVAVTDPHDSVGILDQYFPDASYFREFERFDRHVEKLRRANSDEKVDYVSICSPNHLHDAHIRFALRVGADAICEKPLVLKPWNLDALQTLEQEFGKRVYSVLQLRLHPAITKLRKKIISADKAKRFRVKLTYVTGRGKWYRHSWKGNEEQSGGLVTNIGIHFFDILLWLFGNVRDKRIYTKTNDRVIGFFKLDRADVDWHLSTDIRDIPHDLKGSVRTYRALVIDDDEVEFSGGFTDLHTEVYRNVITGQGYGIGDVRPSIELVYNVRMSKTYG